MSGNVRESLLDDREWSGCPHGWSWGPIGCPGVVGRPSQMPGSGREALSGVWEWSGGLPGCLGVVVRPSWVVGKLSLVVGKLSRVVGMDYRMTGSGREALLNV